MAGTKAIKQAIVQTVVEAAKATVLAINGVNGNDRGPFHHLNFLALPLVSWLCPHSQKGNWVLT